MSNIIEHKLKHKQEIFIRTYIKIMIFINIPLALMGLVLYLLYDYGWMPFLFSSTSLICYIISSFFVKNIYAIPFKDLVNSYLILYTFLISFWVYIAYPCFPVVIFYFISFPFAIYMVNSLRVTVLCTTLLCSIIIGVIYFSNFTIYYQFFEKSSSKSLHFYLDKLMFYFPLFSEIFILVYLVYYLVEFSKIKAQKEYIKSSILIGNTTANNVEEDNLDILYKNIIEKVEQSKAYLDSNFDLTALADALNSNRTYVSLALNKKGGISFYDFINKYRVEKVLYDLQNSLYQTQTLQKIYTQAGFSQQTSFNRAFKKVTGKSPSEYIKSLEN